MKNLNNFIQEKLVINSKSKLGNEYYLISTRASSLFDFLEEKFSKDKHLDVQMYSSSNNAYKTMYFATIDEFKKLYIEINEEYPELADYYQPSQILYMINRVEGIYYDFEYPIYNKEECVKEFDKKLHVRNLIEVSKQENLDLYNEIYKI